MTSEERKAELFEAFRRGDLDGARELLLGASPKLVVDFAATAALAGQPAMLQLAIDAGCDPNAEYYSNPILLRSCRGGLETMKVLVGAGADITKGSLLVKAVLVGDIDVVEFLLAQGADPNKHVAGYPTALQHAQA